MMRFIKGTLDDLKVKGTAHIPDDMKGEIGELCDFLAIGRTTIHHDFKGEIDEIPEPEFPTRVYNTICKLTEIHASIHGRMQASDDDKAFAFRLILDNIPTIRLRILGRLRTGEQTTSQIGKHAELPTPTAKRVLDELTALHLVVKIPRDMKDDDDSDTDKRSDSFYLSDEVAAQLDKLRGVIRIGSSINRDKTLGTPNPNRPYESTFEVKNNLHSNNESLSVNDDNTIPLESHPSILLGTPNSKIDNIFNLSEPDANHKLQKSLINASKQYEQEHGTINSDNVISFSYRYCEQFKPRWVHSITGESGDYTPSAILGICRKVFKLTPETTPTPTLTTPAQVNVMKRTAILIINHRTDALIS